MIKAGSYFIATAGERDDYRIVDFAVYRVVVDIDLSEIKPSDCKRLAFLLQMIDDGLVERVVKFSELHMGFYNEIDLSVF